MMLPVVLCLLFQASIQDAPLHEGAGLAALQAGQKDVAIREFSAETRANPEHAEGYYYLGLAYLQNGDYGLAIPALKKALVLKPDLGAAHAPLGYSLLAQGYATEAVTQFEAARDQAGLGIAQLSAGDLPAAVTNLQAAVKARYDDPDLVYYLARASGLLSKQLYDALLSSQPGSPRANQALADNYAAVRQAQAAEDHYLAALKARPSLPGVYLSLGQVYADAGQWKQAEDAFRAETKLQPGNAEAAYRLGSALLHDGNPQEASVELLRADHLQPDMAETLFALGKAEASQNHYAEAEKAWHRVIDLEKTGELAAQSHFNLATLYRKQGRTADAGREMKEFQEHHQEK